jgi:uncharacterized protein UPF0158
MKELPIDLDELIAEATWNGDEDFSPFTVLDTHTGELLFVPREVWREIEEQNDFDEPLDEEQILAQRISQDYDTEDARYRTLPELDSDESFRFMQDFVYGHAEGAVRDSLSNALEKRKPFRSFKDALLHYPEVRDQWFAYEGDRHREWVLRWLDSLDICLPSNVVALKPKPSQ